MMPRVKELTADDLAYLTEISALERRIFTDAWDPGAFVDAADSAVTHVYAALGDADELMGYLIFTQVMDSADVDNIAAAPEFRRQGVASALLHHVLDGLDADVFLEVRISNTGARALYERFGFTQIGIRRNYYENPREDAVLMKRERDTTC